MAVGKNPWEPVYKHALGTKVGDYCADNKVGSPGTHVSLSPILHHKGGPLPLGRMSGGHLGLPLLAGIKYSLLLTGENVVRRNPSIHSFSHLCIRSTFLSSFVHAFIFCQSLFLPLVFVLAILP